ncbi:hypothetical protein [Halioglobus japonicus]|nr:hypothetical protein [Halioglobus japonicus]
MKRVGPIQLSGMLSAAALLVSCSAMGVSKEGAEAGVSQEVFDTMRTVEINNVSYNIVAFRERKDDTGKTVYCPFRIKDLVTELDTKLPNQYGAWQAYAKNANGKWAPADVEYSVWFDPFQGPVSLVPAEDIAGAMRTDVPILTDAPRLENGALYKFTIAVDSEACPPLDPYFRVIE